jgi:hypothetical protein
LGKMAIVFWHCLFKTYEAQWIVSDDLCLRVGFNRLDTSLKKLGPG